ncbi:Serpin domain-containing protein [Ilyonectria destructans]|nr:Serpin domain-containing protein [Ilyonectria destructans]
MHPYDMDRRPPPSPFRAKKYDKFGFPRFELESTLSILPMLEELGFPVRGPNPEMGSGRNEAHSCIHRAIIKLNEEGTEAAAATAMVKSRSRSKQPLAPEILIFDRPFAFSVHLDDNDAAVFAGLFFGR